MKLQFYKSDDREAKSVAHINYKEDTKHQLEIWLETERSRHLVARWKELRYKLMVHFILSSLNYQQIQHL